MAGFAVALLIAAYWLRESVLAMVALICFALAGAYFYDISTSAWDLFGTAGFAFFFGGSAVSALSVYLGRKKKQEEESLDELDNEIPLGDDKEGKDRRKRGRSAQRSKRDAKKAQKELDGSMD